MAEKKRWRIRWKSKNGEVKETTWGGPNGITLKTMYDIINEWHSRTVENKNAPDNAIYYIVGEAK